ncbi:hypothetical protein HUT06_05805 [Actinomadura sp. NAK00032]|uniref:hypothetical protein n=1 Tax=Actinomadura sp. NAK00032 TaxID=2742128 RepID=UPI0015922164|nr:hypothetical protein [Actinomadura sp. NAK00032]QKW33603.1 hypothetical protein HUT06_05805 [Actinomadura sp. NAK00032]
MVVRSNPRPLNAETARRDLRRDSIFFVVIAAVSLALGIVIAASDAFADYLVLVQLMEAMVALVMLPVSAFALVRSWLRWRKTR